MAKSAAQYQREYRERKAERAKQAGDPTDAIATIKFCEYLEHDGNWYGGVLTSLHRAGFQPISGLLETDVDPGHNPDTDGPYRASIGFAERMVGNFLDAAVAMAGMINAYKRGQIDAAITKLAASDLLDPVTKKKALADIVRLNRIRTQLDKDVRWTIPQWRLKGE